MLSKILFENFTLFENLSIEFSPGINVFIGANGTGKTHILKTAYAASDIPVSGRNFADKLEKVFYPSRHQLGRLARRYKTSITAKVVVSRITEGKKHDLSLSFSNHTNEYEKAKIKGVDFWSSQKAPSVFIPVKDMMSNAPGFRSLYAHREIHFEEIYDDIIARALLSQLKGPIDNERKKLLDILQKAIKGKVIVKNEEFFLKNTQGELEFTLLAEGLRKLALLWVLIQNGTLLNGATLFWDEPEANLNPMLMSTVAEILVALQRMGVQIFVATHDFVFLKWLSLHIKEKDKILFHSLYRSSLTRPLECASTPHYDAISPNAIDDGYNALTLFEIQQDLGGLGK